MDLAETVPLQMYFLHLFLTFASKGPVTSLGTNLIHNFMAIRDIFHKIGDHPCKSNSDWTQNFLAIYFLNVTISCTCIMLSVSK